MKSRLQNSACFFSLYSGSLYRLPDTKAIYRDEAKTITPKHSVIKNNFKKEKIKKKKIHRSALLKVG
jgi:hypothetical protein